MLSRSHRLCDRNRLRFQAEPIGENYLHILRGPKDQKCERLIRESIHFLVLLFAIANRDSGRTDGILHASIVLNVFGVSPDIIPESGGAILSLEFSARSAGAPHGAWNRLVERFVAMSYFTELLFP